MQTIILRGKGQRSTAKALIDKAPPDTVVTFRPPARSLDQNALMWALLSRVSRAKPEGRHWPPETWKCAFMHALGHQVAFAEGLDGSGPFPIGFRSSRLTKEQMSRLIEAIIEYSIRHGIDLDDIIEPRP